MPNFVVFKLSVIIVVLTPYSKEWPQIQKCNSRDLVALTFDDGPSPNGGTSSVLNVLREEEVRATFFVTGKGYDSTWLDEDVEKQDILRQIFYEGHQIGSHSWNHDNFTEKSLDEIRIDVNKLAVVVRNLIGVNMTVFRAPYGEADANIAKLLEDEFDYQLIFWSIDTKDWFNKEDTESSLMNYKNRIEDLTSFITLHHCPETKSGELARKAINFMKSHGFKFVTVAECIGVYKFKYI